MISLRRRKQVEGETPQDTLRPTIISVALILLSIVAAVFIIRWYKSVVPEHVDRDTISVTQADLELAREQWQTNGIVEYEIKTEDRKDLVSLRVNRETDTVYLLEYVKDGFPQAAQGIAQPFRTVEYEDWTVEALFDRVEVLFDQVRDPSISTSPDENGVYYYTDFIVRFNPDYGYPEVIEQMLRTTRESREFAWRESISGPRRVTEFRVIK